MLKIRTISLNKLQRVFLALTLILSVSSFSGSAFASSNFHQAPQQSELLFSSQCKRRSSVFSFSSVLKTNSHFFLNHPTLEKAMQKLYSELTKILFLVIISQHFLKEIMGQFISLKIPSIDSDDPNLNFSLG